MKKILTAISGLMVMGSLSMSAQSTTPTITPNTVEPGTYAWGGDIAVQWGDDDIYINTSSSDISDYKLKPLDLYIDSEVAMDGNYPCTTIGRICVWNTNYDGYWDDVDLEEDPNSAGKALVFGLGSSLWEKTPADGQVLTFTIPAGVVLIGESKQENPQIVVTVTCGDVEYDDTDVKTFNSSVTFTGSGNESCRFITRLSDNSNMAVLSNSSTNLSDYISITYTYGDYSTTYDFDAVKMTNGDYGYNFKNVTDYEVTFKYTGSEAVTFTFQQDWVEGEQEGGMKNLGNITWNVPFNFPGKETGFDGAYYTYTFPETYQDDTYIKLGSNTNVLQNGSLVVGSANGSSLIDGWKTGSGTSATFTLISATDGSYGYTGIFNAYAGQTIYIYYTGTAALTVTMGDGLFTENGVAEYMPLATVTPTTVSVSDTSAGIDLSWGETVYINDADYTMTYSFNGQPEDAPISISEFFQFVDSAAGEPEPGLSTYAVANGDSGETLVFLMGGALNNDLQVGTYEFTFPKNVVKNAKGAYNTKQTFTITVISPTQGVVSPVEGTEFEYGEDVSFTITFDGAPVPTTLENPVMVTNYIDADDGGYEVLLNWADDALYVDGNSIVVNLGDAMPAGTFYLSLAEGAVTINGTNNEAIDMFRFVVNEGEETSIGYLPIYPNVTPDPTADALAPFDEVTVEWPDYDIIINIPVPNVATFNGVEVLGSVVGNVLTFGVNAETSGSYALVVPKDYIIATDEEGTEYFNNSLQYVFVVDATLGVQVVGTDANGLFNVVNLNGVKVLSTKDANAVKNLPKGIYIINGKKVQIK